MTVTPLTVLDLVSISSGSNATQALRNSARSPARNHSRNTLWRHERSGA
jgi:hypothetical protein